LVHNTIGTVEWQIAFHAFERVIHPECRDAMIDEPERMA
jgi:oligoendopeptidase F